LRVALAVGTDDVTSQAMARLDQLAAADGFETRFVVQAGYDHGDIAWHDAFRDALPWIASSFRPAPNVSRT
jgi:S-formylglutathione hydrolase FrmB